MKQNKSKQKKQAVEKTKSIDVRFLTTYLTSTTAVQARVLSDCGNSLFGTLSVAKTVPVAPTFVTPVTTNPCPYIGSGNVSYSVTSLQTKGANGYLWTVPTGASIVKVGNTTIAPSSSISGPDNNIEVQFTATPTTGAVIAVQALSVCGNSTAKNQTLTKTKPLLFLFCKIHFQRCFFQLETM